MGTFVSRYRVLVVLALVVLGGVFVQQQQNQEAFLISQGFDAYWECDRNSESCTPTGCDLTHADCFSDADSCTNACDGNGGDDTTGDFCCDTTTGTCSPGHSGGCLNGNAPSSMMECQASCELETPDNGGGGDDGGYIGYCCMSDPMDPINTMGCGIVSDPGECDAGHPVMQDDTCGLTCIAAPRWCCDQASSNGCIALTDPNEACAQGNEHPTQAACDAQCGGVGGDNVYCCGANGCYEGTGQDCAAGDTAHTSLAVCITQCSNEPYCCVNGGCGTVAIYGSHCGSERFATQQLCDAGCNVSGNEGYCCAADGSCNSAAAVGTCPAGEPYYSTLNACNTGCGTTKKWCCDATGGPGCIQAGTDGSCANGSQPHDDQQSCNSVCGGNQVVCGDGDKEGTEECDDGNTKDNDGCSSGCKEEKCGDGVKQTDEECDDGNTNDADACTQFCKHAVCGDGFTQAGEECDQGDQNWDHLPDKCRTSCKNPSCGDGTQDTGEECDDGNTANDDGCSSSCKNEPPDPDCGNGKIDGNEECDDGNQIDDDACTNACRESKTCLRCGDTCKEVVGNGTLGCPPNTPGVEVECEYVNNKCVQTNVQAECGDNKVEGSEECDDGNTKDNDACSSSCKIEKCGDGVLQISEFCDDGNTVSGDGCSSTCVTETSVCVRCGDDRCTDSPRTVDCGQATPGITVTCEIINGVCQVTNSNQCGNGQKEGAEECDDGNTVDDDGCSADCKNEAEQCLQDNDCTQDPGEDYLCLGPVDEDTNIVHTPTFSVTVQAGDCYYEAQGCVESECRAKVFDCECPNNFQCEKDLDCPTPIDAGCSTPTRTTRTLPSGFVLEEGKCYTPTTVCKDNSCADSAIECACAEQSLCGNGQLDDGEECDGDINDACSGTHLCNAQCSCQFVDVNICGNDPKVCCAPGATQRCCSGVGSKAANNETICWKVGEEPPAEACDAVGPCGACVVDSDCQANQLCFDGICSNYTLDDVWVDAGESRVFDTTVGHSVVAFPQGGVLKMWDVYQSWEMSFVRTNIASAESLTWNKQQSLMSGNPALAEFTHLTFAAKQWIIGGIDFSDAPRRSRDVWSSADGIIWQNHANALPTNIDQHASVVFGGKMWILGGIQSGDDASDIILSSHNGTTWTQAGTLPTALTLAEAVVINGNIVLLGGRDSDGNESRTVWESGDGVNWKEIGTLPIDFSGRSAAVFADRIWIVGEAQSTSPLTHYSADGGITWQQFATPDTEIAAATDIVSWNGALFLVGGYNDDRDALNEVHYITALPSGSCKDTQYENPYFCPNSSSSVASKGSDGSSSSRRFSSSEDNDDEDDGGGLGGDNGDADDGDGDNDDGIRGNDDDDGRGNGSGGGNDDDDGPSYACGNGKVEGAEECDDGNRDGGDGCNRNCFLEQRSAVDRTALQSAAPEQYIAVCGNGVKDAKEECDDGNTVSKDGCSPKCKYELRAITSTKGCGNGIVEKREECDDGNKQDNDGCSSKCKVELKLLVQSTPVCGNGVKESGEECDLGKGNSDTLPDTCRTNCKEAYCGDGMVDVGEFCDNGTGNSDTQADRCRTDCRVARCGDGAIDRGEECDDGNITNGDGCSSTCEAEETLRAAASVCGDGVLETVEECDDGNKRDGDGCTSVCLLEVGICGDGIVQSLIGEHCEMALHSAALPYRCVDCKFYSETCGDSIVDVGEECDNGQSNSKDPGATCRPQCYLAHCGDGILDPEEQCDDGNRVNRDGCDWTCKDETLVLSMAEEAAKKAAQAKAKEDVAQSARFPQIPSYQALPYQLPLAQLQPLIVAQGPAGDTGPAAVAVAASGMAAGYSWIRRRKRK